MTFALNLFWNRRPCRSERCTKLEQRRLLRMESLLAPGIYRVGKHVASSPELLHLEPTFQFGRQLVHKLIVCRDCAMHRDGRRPTLQLAMLKRKYCRMFAWNPVSSCQACLYRAPSDPDRRARIVRSQPVR